MNTIPACLLASSLLSFSLSAAPVPPPEAVTAALTAARNEAEWPGLTVADAARNLQTADNAANFVRNGIANAAYSGAFQGAEGALRTRSANSMDKAILLAKILNAQGWEAGVVAGPLPTDAKSHQASGLDRARPALAALQTLVAPHGTPPTTRTLSPFDQERAKLDSIRREVDATYTALQATLQTLDWKPTSAAPPLAPEQKGVWVGARKPGGDWRLFTPSMDSKETPATFKTADISQGTLSLAIEAVDQTGNATALLNWSGDTGTVAGQDLHIGWIPKDERAKDLANLKIPLAIKIKQWQPSLRIGATELKGQTFTLPANASVLRLRLELNHQGTTKSMTRVLQDLGAGFDEHEMFSTHRIGIAAAGIPAPAVEARILDELLDMSQLNQFVNGAARPTVTSNQRGLSTRSTEIINAMITSAAHLDPTGEHLTWQGPTIFLETTRLAKRDKKMVTFTLLDMLNQSFAPAQDAPAELKMKWGLAVNATEARLVKGTSVNRLLTEADGPLTKVAAMNKSGLLASADLVIGNSKVPNAALALNNDGTLRGVITDRALVQAKGGRSEDRATTAATAFAALGGAALPSPLGPLVGGIAGYLNELAKAYRGAAAKLDWLARTIEAGHVVEDTSNADEQMRNLAGNLLRGFGEGYATSYVSSGMSSMTSGALNTGPAASSAIDFGYSIATSAATMDADTIRGAFMASTPAR